MTAHAPVKAIILIAHCPGTLHNGQPCNRVLFRGTLIEFKGWQEWKCPKCGCLAEMKSQA